MRNVSLALLLSLPLFAADAPPLTLEHLSLDLRVDHAKERIDGTARLTVRNVSDKPVASVPLLLNRLMQIKDVSQAVVIFEDEPKLQVTHAQVKLAEPLAAGARGTIDVQYGGPLVGYTETGMLYVKDHVSEDFTIIREDAYAFPSIGVPNALAMKSAPRGDFTFDLRVTVPAGYVVAAGGTPGTSSDTTFQFSSEVPIPFLNIAVARYKVVEDGAIRVYALPDDAAHAPALIERTRKTLELYESWFGPLAKPPRVTIIGIPDGYGPQASAVAGIILESKVFRDPGYLYSLYHEVGHFWNVRDSVAPSPRWEEGLSTWFQEVVPETLDEKLNTTFGPWMFARLQKNVAGDERLKRVALKDYGRELMTDDSYSVGYLYLKVVEAKIGRFNLLAALREFFQQHKTSGGTLSDFVAILERRHPATKTINADWLLTPAWASKIEATKTIADAAARY